MSRLIYHGALGGVLASLLVGMAPVVADAGSQSKTYYLPAGDARSHTAAPSDALSCNSEGVENVCFDLSGGGSVHISIADQTGQPTPARVFFWDSAMGLINSDAVLVCGSGDVDIPDGGAKLEVRISVLGRGTITVGSTTPPDLACGKPSPASTGSVTASGPAIGGSSAASSASVTRTWSRASAPVTGRGSESTFRFVRTARPV